jgi:catalase (peroxidase I)
VLLYACRQTDYVGGCNGAYIRLEPQKDWPTNKGLDHVLSVLEPIKDKYPTLSYADLIVLAGTVAVAHAAKQGAAGAVGGAVSERGLFSFCPKRSDAAVVGPEPLDYLEPRSYKSADIAFRCDYWVSGLSPQCYDQGWV